MGWLLHGFKRVLLRLKAIVADPSAPWFHCPVCGYRGPFLAMHRLSGDRRHAQCPDCKSLERHRLQYLVLEQVLRGRPCKSMRMLHFAPEPFMQGYFRRRFRCYETADLHMTGVDHKVDLAALPFESDSYDFVFASHVLEHVRDDHRALAEIRRILAPGGIAVLPVPLVAETTVEYPEPNPAEDYHVRAPGYDYYDRYRLFFARIDQYASDAFPFEHQVYIYGDRSQFPTAECPWRTPMAGDRHADVVPVCYR
ncbi:MAG: class I SAM-dependent methyltransferase [Pseudomonadota bacterium]